MTARAVPSASLIARSSRSRASVWDIVAAAPVTVVRLGRAGFAAGRTSRQGLGPGTPQSERP